jgi:hypothetical protein
MFDRITFKDFYLLSPIGSLKKQSPVWGVDISKMDFDIANKSREWFESNKSGIIEYCAMDVRVLKECHKKFMQLLSQLFPNIESKHLLNKCTIASLSVEILSSYLEKSIFGTVNKSIYDIERESYFGGICYHTVKECGEGWYYDINSSYPNSMRENLPVSMRGIIEYDELNSCLIDLDILNDTNLYLVSFEYNDDVICCMTPQRTSNGLLIYCKNINLSWRWGVELNFLMANKKIKKESIFIKSEILYTGEKICKEFIDKVYELKEEAVRCNDIPKKTLYKLILNSTYGKFGQRSQNKFLIKNKHDVGAYLFDEDLEIKDIKLVENEKGEGFYQVIYEDESLNFIGSLVRLSSYIAVLSRINLFKGVYSIGDAHVKYMDTDSIMSDKEMSEGIGNKIGEWKLESRIKRGRFWGPKMYEIEDFEGEVVSKIKGINTDDVDLEKFRSEGICRTKSKDFFKKSANNSIRIVEQSKEIKEMDSRRVWLDDGRSVPYESIDSYNRKL